MAKNNNSMWWIIGLLFVAVVWYGGTHDWFKSSNFSTTNYQSSQVNPDVFTKDYDAYAVTLTLNPDTICVRQSTTGRLDTNIPNGVCTIFTKTDSTPWQILRSVNLNSIGVYSLTTQINSVGKAYFIAICCDAQGNCKISNQGTLTVNPCNGDNDNDGNPDNIDPDDDNDGYSDEEENQAGTDPLDPDSHPESSTCNSQCISKGFVSGRGPFESGSSCTGTEVIEYLTGESGLICCCLPAGGDGELPMTAPECDAWRISMGKTSYTLVTTSLSSCENYAWNNCNGLGLIVKYYDFHPNCCIWSCMEMQ